MFRFQPDVKRYKSVDNVKDILQGHKIFECVTLTTRLVLGYRTDRRRGTLQQAEAEQHGITEVAPNELKVDEGA